LGLVLNLNKLYKLEPGKDREYLERMLSNEDLNEDQKDAIMLDYVGDDHGIIKRDSEGNIIKVVTKDDFHPLDKNVISMPAKTETLKEFETTVNNSVNTDTPFMRNKERTEAETWIKAYGTNYKKCFFDLEVNPYQYTEECIRKTCEDYKLLCAYTNHKIQEAKNKS